MQHDTANYGPGFVQGRGNLNRVLRWDVTDPNNTSEYETGYNTSGSVIFTRDPLDHPTNISYDDSFSDGQNNRNTYAYPTTVTDADQNPSTVQYNYDFGAVTQTQNPKNAVVTRTYDAVGRIERITNMINGAYTRYIYGPNQLYVQSLTTINDLSSEFYQIKVFDGHGRVRGTASDHPTSVGQYKAQNYVYDVMGRLAQQTNPTEINVSWVPAGDDAAGWVWSYQSYDWKGRLTVTTNQDDTTKTISYGGCGCAGGAVMTITDEGTVIMVNGQPQTKRRQQKVFHDILGRVIKTQVLNWEGGTPYSTTINTYNARDQITSIKEYSGDATGAEACPSSTCQKTDMTYDGHGRLWKQRRPIETADNVYLYNPDDTLWKKTDPRGINSVYSYNNRGLVTGISYDALPNAVLPPPIPSQPIPSSNVTFGYDEAGNRLWMDDSPGRVDYVYDQLSRLKEEIRLFDIGSVTRSFSLKYEYNLAGQLKQLTDPWNSTVTYNRDNAGREISVTGVGYKDQNHDVNVFASNIQYRAWDGIKQFANGSRGGYTSFAMGYDDRMRLTSYTGNGRTTEHDYYNDGLIKEVRDLYYGPDFLRKYVLLPDNIRTNARHHRVFLPTLFDTIEDGMRDIIRILPDIIMILPTLNAIIRDIGKKRW